MSCCAKARASAAGPARSPVTSEPGDEAAVAGREIVVDDRMITGRRQRPAAMRADIARAAGDQNGRTIAHVSLAVSRSVADGRLLLNSRYSARGLVVR